MIAANSFIQALKRQGVGLFAGVPDSLLAPFCACLRDECSANEHVLTANEGNAVALAAGHYMATGKIGVVYAQNSGLGNCVNPLASLTDPEVYAIPLLLIIGWRGEPGVSDEPQHVKQGRITPRQLELLDIPYHVLASDSDYETILDTVFDEMRRTQAPSAVLVRKGTFEPFTGKPRMPSPGLRREDALREIVTLADPDDLLVSTTGKTSRELFEIREQRGERHADFLTVGSMGHASSIALGTALGNPRRRVICLDGDGAALMHLGALPIIGNVKPANLLHVLLNNAAHESVGGQPTVAGAMDFEAIVRACGYRYYRRVDDVAGLRRAWRALADGAAGPAMLEIRIAVGARSDLGRPTMTPEQMKTAFMEAARDDG